MSKQPKSGLADSPFFQQPDPATQKTSHPGTQETGKPGEREIRRPAAHLKNRPESRLASQSAGVSEKQHTISPEPGKPATWESGHPAAREANLIPARPDNPLTRRKITFEASQEEADYLDDLKLELRRRYQLRLTKNDILRAAVELMRKEYELGREASFLVRKFNSS